MSSPTPVPAMADEALYKLFQSGKVHIETPPIYDYPKGILEKLFDNTRIPVYRYFSQRDDGTTCKVGVLHRIQCEGSVSNARCEGRLYERGRTTCMDADSKIVIDIQDGKIDNMELHPNLSSRNLDLFIEANDGSIALPSGSTVYGEPVDKLRTIFPSGTYHSNGMYRVQHEEKDVAYATDVTCEENYVLDGSTKCSGKLILPDEQQPTGDIQLTLERQYLKNQNLCRHSHFDKLRCFKTRKNGDGAWTSSGSDCG